MSTQPEFIYKIEDLWRDIDTGGFEPPIQKSQVIYHETLQTLRDSFDQLEQPLVQAGLIEAYEGYLQGRYKEVLRRLEKTASLPAVLIKVLCLLQMAVKNEAIAQTPPTQYLRDKVLPQLKQVEGNDETGRIKVCREWLEAFCYGRALNVNFREGV
jgi:hypothetical protein